MRCGTEETVTPLTTGISLQSLATGTAFGAVRRWTKGKWMGLGSLRRKIVRKLALRWARGKVKKLRGKDKETGMGKFLKLIDGWKFTIGVISVFVAKVYDGLANGHAGDIIGSVVDVLGWSPEAFGGPEIAVAAGAAGALIGFGHKLWKARKQLKAGAPVSDLLSTGGYVVERIEETIDEAEKDRE